MMTKPRKKIMMSEQTPKTRFGLTPAEYDNLMQAVRYGVIIVATILITFTIVATVAKFIGYEPPSASSESAELTPETGAIILPNYSTSRLQGVNPNLFENILNNL